MPPSQRRKRRRRRGGGGTAFVWLAVGFVLVWSVALWISHASLSGGSKNDNSSGSIRTSHESGMGLPLRPANDEVSRHLDHDSYYGWQPVVPDAMRCSWRECFKADHPCTTCRDRVEDLGSSPPPPPSVDWIPDVTVLARMRREGRDARGRAWPPPLDAELCEPMGPQGGKRDINKELLDRVPIVAQSPPADGDDDGPKVLCMIYTMETAHATTVRAIRETWASHCDGFLAFSTASDPRIPAISLSHEGPEAYDNMWQKVRSIWKFVGTHYLDQFDWFFQGGDDLFVLPQNLRNYLHTLGDPEADHFVGRRFKGYGQDNYFNSGGSGYALSRGLLRRYIETGWTHPQCAPTRRTSMEDVMIARCLRHVLGVNLTDTRDTEGRERFHPFAPGTHWTWKPPAQGAKDWYADYNREWPVQLGAACCAPDSVSFHYIKKPAMVRHIYALLYECKRGGNAK